MSEQVERLNFNQTELLYCGLYSRQAMFISLPVWWGRGVIQVKLDFGHECQVCSVVSDMTKGFDVLQREMWDYDDMFELMPLTIWGKGWWYFAILDWLWEGLCIIMGGKNYQGRGAGLYAVEYLLISPFRCQSKKRVAGVGAARVEIGLRDIGVVFSDEEFIHFLLLLAWLLCVYYRFLITFSDFLESSLFIVVLTIHIFNWDIF